MVTVSLRGLLARQLALWLDFGALMARWVLSAADAHPDQRLMRRFMDILDNLAQLDWTRGVRMWVLVAAALAACEAAYLFHRAVFRPANGADDVR